VNTERDRTGFLNVARLRGTGQFRRDSRDNRRLSTNRKRKQSDFEKARHFKQHYISGTWASPVRRTTFSSGPGEIGKRPRARKCSGSFPGGRHTCLDHRRVSDGRSISRSSNRTPRENITTPLGNFVVVEHARLGGRGLGALYIQWRIHDHEHRNVLCTNNARVRLFTFQCYDDASALMCEPRPTRLRFCRPRTGHGLVTRAGDLKQPSPTIVILPGARGGGVFVLRFGRSRVGLITDDDDRRCILRKRQIFTDDRCTSNLI